MRLRNLLKRLPPDACIEVHVLPPVEVYIWKIGTGRLKFLVEPRKYVWNFTERMIKRDEDIHLEIKRESKVSWICVKREDMILNSSVVSDSYDGARFLYPRVIVCRMSERELKRLEKEYFKEEDNHGKMVNNGI